MIECNRAAVRTKPMQSSYGCYGHLRGSFADKRLRQELRKNLRERGPYVIQPEMHIPTIINETDGKAYAYIDRNFLAFTNGQPRFLGGFRSLMPIESKEAQNGRIHGNGSTVWAEIQ